MPTFQAIGRRLLFTCAACVIGAQAAVAQINAPIEAFAVPRFESSVTLVVKWTDVSPNEQGFEVEVREEGGTFGPLGTVGANVEELVDTAATPDKFWEYRVRATHSTLVDSAWTAVTPRMSPRQVWPIDDGDHDVVHGFGSPLNFSDRKYFHRGVDLAAGGKRASAARGGVVANKDNLGGGQLWVDVDYGADGIDGDVYSHMTPDAVIGPGDVLAPGDPIGEVRDDHFGGIDDEANHVHWGIGTKNNLIPFIAEADRDPYGEPPSVGDVNGDGEDFIVVPFNDNDHSNPREPAWGGVDFLVDAWDDMYGSVDLRASPFRIGYWIQGVPGGEHVRSAASPYRLVQFDFALQQPGDNPSNEDRVVYWDLDADLDGVDSWQSCFTWILTNTNGTTGAKANFDTSQFWKTDARTGTGAAANGSDASRARENQEARFPDGTYFVHVLVDDLVHETDHVRSVLVDNSRPYVRRATIFSGARIVYQAEWLWDGGAAQLSIQPATFDAAAPFTALRTQDVTIELEFSEPMSFASVTVAPLGETPTLASSEPTHARRTWRGTVSNLDIADNGADDGVHLLTINGVDLAGNPLLRIGNRNPMGADHHNRDGGGVIQGTAGADTIHGFEIGPLSGVVPVTALFMKQTAMDPASPAVAAKALDLQQALNAYFDEVSYGELSFAVTGHGWYPLDQPLDWYYTTPQTPLVDLVQEALDDAGADGVPLAAGDYVLVVTDETVERDEWSTNGGWPYELAGSPASNLIASGVLNLATTDARLSNLVGRSVGLIDLFAYPHVTVARPFVGPWSHMSDKEADVHVLGWEKWRVGWLDETGTATGKTLERIAKPPTASPITNQTFTLRALDSNANGSKMLAVELADGLHYTAEYRRLQGLDAALPEAGVVIVKANDLVNQGEGPVIVQESPVTTGDLDDAPFVLAAARDVFDDTGSGVNIEVTSIAADQAQVRLNYDVPSTQNDVFVSPHDDRWEAVDIWVDAPDIEGNFAADPRTVLGAAERPVLGMVNRVIGRVRNQGPADATNFEVELEILEPWGSGGTWHSLKVEIVPFLQGQDTNPGADFLIVSDWTPTAGEHTCVKLTVRGLANDVNLDNNWTQENIHRFATSPGSPYAPITTQFQVENPYDETLPILLRLDGLPDGWSYLLTPERPVLGPGATTIAQVTIQPHDEAPLCSREKVTITAYAPRVDTLNRLGAITLQVELTNAVDVTLQSWVNCYTVKDPKQISTHMQGYGRLRCDVMAQGCTDPPLPNTEIAIVYTAPDGTVEVHYVTTDANGCYLDLLQAGQPGLWEVEAVLEEDDCRSETRTPPVVVDVRPEGPFGGGGSEGIGGFTHFGVSTGGNWPLGRMADDYDADFNFIAQLERPLNASLRLGLQVGYHAFNAEPALGNDNLGITNVSVLGRWRAGSGPSHPYALVGLGAYNADGSWDAGVQAGIGLEYALTPAVSLTTGIAAHFVNGVARDEENYHWVDATLGFLIQL